MTSVPGAEVLVILELRAKPGHLERLLTVYERNAILELPKSIAGYRGAEMWTDAARCVLVVTSRWSGTDAYDQWLADPRRAAASAEIFDHLDPGPDAFETMILHAAGAARG